MLSSVTTVPLQHLCSASLNYDQEFASWVNTQQTYEIQDTDTLAVLCICILSYCVTESFSSKVMHVLLQTSQQRVVYSKHGDLAQGRCYVWVLLVSSTIQSLFKAHAKPGWESLQTCFAGAFSRSFTDPCKTEKTPNVISKKKVQFLDFAFLNPQQRDGTLKKKKKQHYSLLAATLRQSKAEH